MSVHRIRLRGPWQCQCTEQGIRWSRKFNRPTGLEGAARVWIAADNPRLDGVLHLNGALLGQMTAGEDAAKFEVTGRLELHNELILIAAKESAQPPLVLPAEVSLEIVDLPA